MQGDEDLAVRSRSGERAAFAELVRRCTPMVCAVAYAATHDRALAEDVAQDAFLAAWHEIASLRDPAAVRPWLCRIARNLAHKARRVRAREHATDHLDAVTSRTPFDTVHDAEVERVVGAALAAVPEPYREALVLYYFEQRSAKSVAAALDVTEDLVHKRISRGRRHLAAGLDDLAERAFRRPARRDLSGGVLALLPASPTSKGSVMWKLALVTSVAAVVGTSAATANVAPARPLLRTSATPARPAMRAPAPPRLPDPTDCSAVAEHVVTLSLDRLPSVEGGRVALTSERLAQLCRRLAWPRSERECLLSATDALAVESCRDAVEAHPGSRDALPVTAEPDALDCPTVGGHVAELMIASMDGTEQDNITASLLTDRDDLRERVRASCRDETWSEPLRRCFAAATRVEQIVVCRRALTSGGT